MTDQPIRTRTRAPIATAAVPVATRAPQGAPQASFMHRGAAADQTRAQEEARQAERRERGYAPFRYWLAAPKDGKPGQQGDIIILDNDVGPCFYEHAIPGPNNDWSKTTHELCPKEYDSCPLCARSGTGESYYVMFLSVIDMRPYTKRNGEIIPFSRKLLAIKTSSQAFFARLKERHGNLRGAHLLMVRDNSNSASIGTPEYIEHVTEEQILQNFAHAEVKAQDGRVVKQANADCYPFQYDGEGGIFRQPSGEALRQKYGGVAPAGSAAEVASEWGANDPAAVAPAPAPVAAAPAPAPAAPVPQAVAPAPQAAAPAPAPATAPIASVAAPAAQPAAPAPGGGITTRAVAAPAPAPLPDNRVAPVPASLDDEIPF